METKNVFYVAPAVEIIEVEVERGFAASGDTATGGGFGNEEG